MLIVYSQDFSIELIESLWTLVMGAKGTDYRQKDTDYRQIGMRVRTISYVPIACVEKYYAYPSGFCQSAIRVR